MLDARSRVWLHLLVSKTLTIRRGHHPRCRWLVWSSWSLRYRCCSNIRVPMRGRAARSRYSCPLCRWACSPAAVAVEPCFLRLPTAEAYPRWLLPMPNTTQTTAHECAQAAEGTIMRGCGARCTFQCREASRRAEEGEGGIRNVVSTVLGPGGRGWYRCKKRCAANARADRLFVHIVFSLAARVDK